MREPEEQRGFCALCDEEMARSELAPLYERSDIETCLPCYLELKAAVVGAVITYKPSPPYETGGDIPH